MRNFLRSLIGKKLRSSQRSRTTQRSRRVERLEARNLLAVVPVGGQGLINETVIREQRAATQSVSAALGSDQSSLVVYDGREALNGNPNDGRRDREGVFVARFDRDGSALGSPTLVNITTQGEQDSPAIASDADGNFVVVWSGRGFDRESVQRDRHGIWMRAFNADGTPVGEGETLVNTTIGGTQHTPAVSMSSDGRFVVTWNGVGAGDADGVFMRSFSADRTPAGDEVLVNTTVEGEQNDVDVDMNDAGEFVVAWNSRHQDGDSWGVVGQVFDATGATDGAEVQLNTTSDSTQYQPTVGINNDGSFVAGWTQFDRDDSEWEIAVQGFDDAGETTLSEQTISPLDGTHQRDLDLDVGNGQFLAAWSRGPTDGSGWEVTAQLFNSDGASDGSELQLQVENTGRNSGHQHSPSVTMNSAQDAVVVWTGEGPIAADGTRSGDHNGVFSQRFESDGPQENVAPDLAAVSTTQAILDNELEIQLTATDANTSDVLTFVIDQDDSANGATIEKTGSRTAVFRWTPTVADGLGDEIFRVLVIDNGDPALSDAEEFTVSVVEDPPEVDLNGPDEDGISFVTALALGASNSVGLVDTDFTIQDRDDSQLAGGVITLANPLDGDNEELSVGSLAGTNITADFDATSGVLTFSGTDSLANYQQALASLTYENTAITPNLSDRRIEFVLTDGENNSEIATTTVRLEEADLAAFAQALSSSATKFFGAGWCSNCTTQKELFEDGQVYLPFIEVTNGDRTPNQTGIDENAFTYPTWEFPDGSRLEGLQTLETISARSGIAIPTGNTPSFEPLPDTTVLVGSPLHVPIDGYDPNGGVLTYNVTSNNPQLDATLLTNNRSLRVETEGFGDMVFELFEQRASRPTDRFIELSDDDFFEDIIFHRVLNDFVIQAGDPTGTGTGGSTLGDFDDQFHVDLQHNRTGLLSMAKSTDDTNDSQFFVTEGPSRSLDFNHSIFGILVEGESNRDNISNTAVDSPNVGRPTIPVTIESTDVFVDQENAVIMLKAEPGATGSATVTVEVSDEQGHTFEQSFNVDLQADPTNGGPFLEDIPSLQTPLNTTLTQQLTAIDVENDAVAFEAEVVGQPATSDASASISANGLLTVTPPTDFTGTLQVEVRVRPETTSDTRDVFDSQLLDIQVG